MNIRPYQLNSPSVILLIDSLLSGGAQRQMIVLANELHRRSYSVTLVTYYPGDQLSEHLDPGIRRFYLPRRFKFDVVFLLRLSRWLRQQRPDCLISYLTTPNFWGRVAGRLARVPKVITSQRNVSIDERRGHVLMERVLSHLSDRIIVNAHEIKRKMLDLGIEGADIHVIYNGVDCNVFCPQAEAKIADLRERLRIAQDEFFVLVPGRISQQKNQTLLVDAVLALGTGLAPIRVAFVGNEFDQAILRTMRRRIAVAGRDGQFLFLGQRHDMSLLYSAADVVVLPSLWEGFPNVVAEAMACGTPVIASDVSDNALIIDHGRTGYVFERDDEDALVRALTAIHDLSARERIEMSRRAIAQIASLCSLKTFGDKYEAVIAGQNTPLVDIGD